MEKRVCRTVVLIIAIVVIMAVSGNAGPPQVIALDYQSGLLTPVGLLELDNGEAFSIRIFNLAPCVGDFIIDVIGVETISPETPERALPCPTELTVPVTHNKRFQFYKVTVTKKGTSPPEVRTWNIPVFTNGWTVDFSGAFTFDLLTNPVYYPEEVSENEYVVTRNKKAEDAVGLGAAAMVHLYHTKRLHIVKKDLVWVPLSFGLGVGGNTETRYYLGTGFRFGDVFYLTLGGVFGKVSRLPADLEEGSPVPNANSLATLPQRYRGAFFVGVSYSFTGGKSKERLEQTFSLSK